MWLTLTEIIIILEGILEGLLLFVCVCYNLIKWPVSTEVGKVSRNCTEFGWTETFPHYIDACLYEEGNSSHPVSTSLCLARFKVSMRHFIWKHSAVCSFFVVLVLTFQDMYYVSVKALYTVGYSTSLVSLTTAMVILCRFRWDVWFIRHNENVQEMKWWIVLLLIDT